MPLAERYRDMKCARCGARGSLHNESDESLACPILTPDGKVIGHKVHEWFLVDRTPAQTASGLKNDSDKPRWDLLPIAPIEAIVAVLTFGARKYSPDNWRRVDNGVERYYAAALRHIVSWRKGERLDQESGLPHLAHAGCCLVFLSELEAAGKGSKEFEEVLDAVQRVKSL